MQWPDRIGRRIKLRDLHILLAVAQSGSISKAARDLAVSHPVVSKVIADLERTLKVRLLERDRRGAEPTAYGRALLKHSLAAFDELRQGVKAIEFLLDPTAGELRIGGPDAMVAGLIPAIIHRLSRQCPRIKFDVTQAPTGLLYQMLREHGVDLLIARLPRTRVDDGLDVEPLYNEPLLVAAGVKNPWARRRQIELRALIDEPWILPHPESIPGILATELFAGARLNAPKNAVVCSALQMNDAFLATGKYLAFYPSSVLQFGGMKPMIKPLPVKLPAQRTPVGIMTLKNRSLSPVAQLFIDYARVVTKSLNVGARVR